MRSVYVVCYDISNDRRLRAVYKKMRGFGQHVQFSVFRCELSARERIEMIAALSEIINHDEDQVLLVDVGPADGRGTSVFEALGRPYLSPERLALVV
jgi:CRISPR-associated protein Cas2